MKDITEGNKLIADFEGYKTGYINGQVPCIITKYERMIPIVEWAQYHYSWNALMPVIEKIARIEIKDCPVINNGEDTFYDSYYLRTFGMVASESKEFMVRINRFPLHSSSSLIEAAWNAVVQFIEWFNKQSK